MGSSGMILSLILAVVSGPTVSVVTFQVCLPCENQVMYPSFLRDGFDQYS